MRPRHYTTLDSAAGGLAATFSTQISYRVTPWASPPADASLVIVITFSSPVTLDAASTIDGWTVTPALGSTGTTTLVA